MRREGFLDSALDAKLSGQIGVGDEIFRCFFSNGRGFEHVAQNLAGGLRRIHSDPHCIL